jgi:hypothetical protein
MIEFKNDLICDLTKGEKSFIKKLMPKTYRKLYNNFEITAIDKNCVYTTIEVAFSYNDFRMQNDFVEVLGGAAKLIQYRRDAKLKKLGIV